MTSPALVDVVVPVHSAARPVGRAVASALADASVPVRVLVVCHGIEPAAIAAALPAQVRADPRVELVHHADGLRSPAGPFNAGLDRATATYVARLDSDDVLAPGALAAWVALAEEHRSDAVMARLETMTGRLLATPRVRPRRRLDLDPVKDRLAYRSMPFGLLRRELVERFGIRMAEGLTTGEDLDFTTRLWTSGGRIDLARTSPPYSMGEDAGDRVSEVLRPVEEELAGTTRLVAEPWFRALPPRVRRANAVKLLRIHVLGALARRAAADMWSAADVRSVGEVTAHVIGVAPGVERPFNRADRAALAAMTDPARSAESLAAAARTRATAGRSQTWLTPRLVDVLDRESTLRYYLANAAWR